MRPAASRSCSSLGMLRIGYETWIGAPFTAPICIFANAASMHFAIGVSPPCEPTRSAWQWVLDTLQLELPEDVGTFVAAEHAGYVDLGWDEEFLPRPVLVLDTRPGDPDFRQVIDVDSMSPSPLSDFAFERHGDAWFVGTCPRGRSKFSARRGVSDAVHLHVNGFSVESPHRLATGDRVSMNARDRHYSECDVTAII